MIAYPLFGIIFISVIQYRTVITSQNHQRIFRKPQTIHFF